MTQATSYSPLVSVVIPTYNSESFVQRAVESALAQSYEPVEVVVVDNASTDGTLDVVRAYRATGLRTYHNPENIGPLGNWRRCVSLARGALTCLLFSDDWYDPDFLHLTVPHLDDDRVGFAYTSARRWEHTIDDAMPRGSFAGASIDMASTGTILYQLPRDGLWPSRTYLESALAGRGPALPVSPSCAVFRTHDLATALSEDIPDPQGVHYGEHGAGPDVWTYLRAASRYPLFAHVTKPLVNLLAHNRALSTQPRTTLAYALAGIAFRELYNPLMEMDREAGAFALMRLWRLRSTFPEVDRVILDSLRTGRVTWLDMGLAIARRVRVRIQRAFGSEKAQGR